MKEKIEESELNKNYSNLEKKLDEEYHKYNDLNIEYKTKIIKLEKNLKGDVKKLNDTKKENENSIKKIKTSMMH